MKYLKYFLIVFLLATSYSCEELEDIFGEDSNGLSEKEVVEGLKTALQVGADTSVAVTSEVNGYYKDEVIKILMPEEAKVIQQWAEDYGFSSEVEKFLKSMNRAAEDAAEEASPIFSDAITSLSISDGWDILNGTNPEDSTTISEFDSTAATLYLVSTTQTSLFDAFQPKIENSLDKDLVGSTSTNEIWTTLTTNYNAVAYLYGGDQVNTDLDEYVTEEALDGLFYKVGKEETEIRRDPSQWIDTQVGDILKKVFDS
ncbi:MAG: DUF4197 domain-containing protein [Bacteroidota bacterium]